MVRLSCGRAGCQNRLLLHLPPSLLLTLTRRFSTMSRRSSSATHTNATKTQLESHASYHARMDAALSCVRVLLSPSQENSKAWRTVQAQQGAGSSSAVLSASSANATQGLAALTGSLSSSASTAAGPEAIASSSRRRLDGSLALLGQPGAVQVHRRTATRTSREHDAPAAPLLPPGSSPSADIYRAVCCIPLKGDCDDLAWADIEDAFRRLLATPECRPSWDQMVDESEVVEELDASMRICRTVFKLGWPASPRDAITISRTIMDANSLIDVSCSLPRSADAPVYLRPAPPYVRSHINLFAWCVERTTQDAQPCVKLTAFWSWDLRGAWVGMPAGGLGARLPHVTTSLAKHVRNGDAMRVPYLSYFGRNVEVTSRTHDVTRDMATVDYQVVCDEEGEMASTDERDICLEWSLPAVEGWDVHITVKPLESHKHSSAEWKCQASRPSRSGRQSARMVVTVQHIRSEAPGGRSLLAEGLRGRITVQRIAASQDVRLRINDEPYEVQSVEMEESHDDAAKIIEPSSAVGLVDDAASISNISLRSEKSSSSTTTTTVAAEETIRRATTPSSHAERIGPQLNDRIGSPLQLSSRPAPDRSAALASMIRRNYIYFTSLLQEPEAKWKHFSDNRGVTITQLDSIDPTLVVYRAEATFVGVGVWDLFAAIANPGVKNAWDKGAEEARLIEDLGDTSKLWWTKMRGAWPVAARDSVVIETVYKSPSSIHIFAFSTDDRKLFPTIPSPETGAIRTQVDLRGWSIESLSPTTAHITLIEQSDPKGWTSKSTATPAAMTAAVAGVGDFAIKQGGPPIATRLLDAKVRMMRYESDKASFRIEYELAASHADDLSGNVECEIRCDVEKWSPSLDVVIDPPPINVSCLRRHKLSQGGSGVWLTIEQPIASLEDDASRISVRKASNKEKGVVYVNGARMKVDVDELKDAEVAQLREQKRTKPKRVPLDLVTESPMKPMTGSTSPSAPNSRAGTPANAAAIGTAAVNLTNATGSLGGAARTTADPHTSDVFSDEKPRQPMTCALDVLFLLRRIHAERSPDPAGNPAGWSLVSNRNGLYTRRKMMHSISPTVIVQRGDKVVEGLTAEDILSAVSDLSCRRLWDEKVESTTKLESYGNGATSGFFTTKQSFPFRGRAFYLASLTARSGPSSTQIGNPSAATVYFHASSSYPDRNAHFSQSKLNPTALPMGKVLIDGWILETLDPYSSTLNYQIPSTRVTHLIAVDYAGSLPATVNAMWNTQLSRSVVHVEDFLKTRGTLPSIRRPPFCVKVLGDGRDEDHDLIWSLVDDKSKRGCTLVFDDFDPANHIYTVVVALDSSVSSHEEVATQLAVPFPRRAALSNASTTRGLASTAVLMGSPEVEDGFPNDPKLLTEGGVPISRTTSVSSLRSTASKSRPSVIRKEVKKPTDFVLLDLEVELRYFEHGYDVLVSSELGEESKENAQKGHETGKEELLKYDASEAGVIDETLEPWPLSTASKSSEVVPVTASSFDLPPSAVLAATLDPASRPKKHLVRLTLPTAAFLDARPNPFVGPEPDNSPQWYRDVRERGASIRVSLKPRLNPDQDSENAVSGTSTSSDGGIGDGGEMDSQRLPVYFKGERIAVTHVNQTSAMLQRESEDEQPLAVLKRVPALAPPSQYEGQAAVRKATEGGLEDRLPLLLQKPIAVAFEFRKDPDEVGDHAQTDLTSPKGVNGLTPSSSLGDTTVVKTPLANRSGEHDGALNGQQSASTPVPASSSTPTSAASAQIMSILNSYPLSRLGASTAVSTTVANGGVFSRRGGADGQAGTEEGGTVDGGSGQASSMTGGVSSDEDKSMPGQLIVATEQIRKRLADVRFTWSTMILTALIAFLLGSLVRSLLEPADFVLVNELTGETSDVKRKGADAIQAAAVREIKRAFGGGITPDHAERIIGEHSVAWRELKRLVEIRNLFGGRWDLVIAAAQR